MKGKKLFIAGIITAATALFAAGCSKVTTNSSGSGGAGDDKEAPVITVTGVPETCKVGDTVTVPAATATDNVDGDVSANVKVTVSQLKEDGETVNRDLLYEKAGNVEQSFNVTSNTLLNYKIVYTCKDSAGNKGESVFSLLATADNETGTLVINESSVPGFTVEGGISGVAGQDVTLPSATAIDQPDDVDISARITARLYEKTGDTVSNTLFASYTDFREAKKVRIPAGTYVLNYSVQDVAGNVFPTTYNIPVTIAQPGKTNLAKDASNFVLDEKEGMSWVNEYGEIAFGNTSVRPDLDQTVGFAENVTKIYDQYVGISFNADPPGQNGQMFYSFSARGSKNRATLPNKETCTWPNYLFLRISSKGIESRVERTCDKEMTAVKSYSTSLLDGKDHTLYVQWLSVGESAEAADAAIMIYGWIDTTPAAGYDNASFIFKAVAGSTNAEGTLVKETFVELWNETGAGWFTMDSYGANRPYEDDHMRLKGFVVYDKNETEFGVDIEAPVVTASFDNSGVFALNEALTIPDCTVTGADGAKSYIVKPDGTRVEVTGSYTPDAEGTYKLLYEAYDDAGNYGYKVWSFKVAVRDEIAPELTLGSLAELSANVGESVTLPSATATDNLDGELSSAVTVEIVGTEHETGLKPGDVYYPMTAGRQKVIYSVADSFGNVATKEIYVNVTGTASGNMLASELTVANNSKGLPSAEHIYEQKVSMILNISTAGSVLMFNTRGPVVNNDWPTGIVIRFVGLTQLSVSASGHDSCIYGSTTWQYLKYSLNTDLLFEYQNKTVTIDGVDYLRTQIWIQGEALEFNATASNGGLVDLETGVKALYRKISDFTGTQAENVYSSPFWVAAYNFAATVKELRIDGTSCAMPEGPTVPDGFEKPAFASGNDFVTGETAISAADGTIVVLGKNSNEDYISVSFKGQDTDKGAFCLNITGTVGNSGWAGGLVLRLSQDGFAIYAGGANETNLAYLSGFTAYSSGINATEYTIVYKLTYIVETDIVVGIQVDVWFGEAGTTLKKLTPSINAAEKCSYDAEKDAFVIGPKAFGTADELAPKNISVVVLSALNGSCAWTVTKIEKLDAAPGVVEVPGYTNPVTSAATNVLLTAERTLSGADTIVKAAENVNESYMSVTFKYNADATYSALGINILGSVSSGWDGGIVLKFCSDGVYLMKDGINGTQISQLKLFAYGNGEFFTVVYKLTYIMKGDVCTGVQLEIWAGQEGGALAKIEAHSVNHEKCTFDEEKKAWILKYDMLEPSQFKSDCTLIMLSAFNTEKEVPCVWTIKSVGASGESPDSQD